ncbi:hypothetical protein K5E_26210 [Enterococcus thailandicus]|uniref:Uncharacterized protein n=1 Tax=Enterococcus thailandicus TaxID=417368 RepID=A0A510WGK0_ENTTH|nr:hypothetical protein ETH01_25430 [Enterococcus thailandicus]GMC03928.1 hypothetical protein K4E_14580 [Enterococcus thailandicus]GMC10482.1 hypothetical protein K5E_26210 [Enterococcus thailandicus]
MVLQLEGLLFEKQIMNNEFFEKIKGNFDYLLCGRKNGFSQVYSLAVGKN